MKEIEYLKYQNEKEQTRAIKDLTEQLKELNKLIKTFIDTYNNSEKKDG